MKTKPILFSTPMVQAISSGQKTMTRRVVSPQPVDEGKNTRFRCWFDYDFYTRYARFEDDCRLALCDRKPKYNPGDILWVRETWRSSECDPECSGHADKNECPFNRVNGKCYAYKAQYSADGEARILKWKPSIFMPREAARLFLRVTNVRVERLQDIGEDDAQAEGCEGVTLYDKYGEPVCWDVCPIDQFQELWQNLNAKRNGGIYAWDKNPWVWVYEFERITREEAEDAAA